MNTYPFKNPYSIPLVEESEDIGAYNASYVDPNMLPLKKSNKYSLYPGFDIDSTHFTDSYAPPRLYYYVIDDGVLLGHRYFLCSLGKPTISKERLYQNKLELIEDRGGNSRLLDVEDGPLYIIGGVGGYYNYYHWIFQCLPAILLGVSFADANCEDYRIIVPPLNGLRTRSLELAGISIDKCIELGDNEFINDKRMFYSGILSGLYSFRPSDSVVGLLEDYEKKCVSLGREIKYPERIFISRKDSQRRSLDNEEELSNALKELDFVEIIMTNLSLEEQVSVFNNSRIIVASHGAGLTNTLFCSPGCHLFEILPENYPNACFFRLAQMKNVFYHQLIAQSSESTDPHQANSRVDVESTVASVKAVIALEI